jgi:hypothetical protein
MKKFLSLSVFCLIVFSACNSSSDNSDGGTTLTTKNSVLYDANGKVGNILSADEEYITLLSSENYIYTIKWTGAYYTKSIYFSESNCAGTAYIIGYDLYGKTVFYSSYLKTFYIPKTINTDGTAYYDTTTKINTSSDDIDGTCYNYSQSNYDIELVETTKTAVGIPDLTLPLSIEFE